MSGAKRGRMDYTLTANEAWTVTITTTAGGPTLVTALASGASSTMYDLCAAFKVALDAAAIGTWTVTPSFGESGTGLITITCDQATYTLAWTSTSLRDAMGFTASVTQVANTQTGSIAADGVWLPDCPKWTKHGDQDEGDDESDTTYTESPRGAVLAMTAQRKARLIVRWSHVTRAKARISGESVVGTSEQAVWRGCHLGELAWCSAGGSVRLIWDADTSATYDTYYIVNRANSDRPTAVQNWNGLYVVEYELVLVPA